jgi:epoxyqueuosine reductase
VGITTPEPPPHMPAYENWLMLGRHGSMGYLAGERALTRRRDPRQILPECRSILMLGMRYLDPKTAKSTEGVGPTGRVASYAWGRDYHIVIPKRLEALSTFIEQLVGNPLPHRWYTDTGPILERDLAQRAGLGWIGKNTCLINPKIGSYFLLAEILIGIDLEPDPPFTADRCGTCTRCIQACPTGCVLPNRTLDAQHCISYLTIENKGEVPAGLRPQMGNWVFGCDVCQMVCPWNQRTTPDPDPIFVARREIPTPALVTELTLSPQAFNKKFKESPFQRTRRHGYLRNLAVAAGNSGNPELIPVLEQALLDDEPLIRSHAEWAIRQLKENG